MNTNAVQDIDRIRVIRRSMRCFVFGIIAAIPGLSLSMSILAFRLQRQIAEETAEPFYLFPLHVVSLIGLAFVGLLAKVGGMVGALEIAVIIVLWQGGGLLVRYRRGTPGEWNPARHLMYWGVWLATVGLFMTLAFLLILIIV